MLVNTPGNYLPVLDQFLAHWAQVNAQLGPAPLVLKGGFTRADLQSARDGLLAAQTPIESAANALQMAQAHRDSLRLALLPLARQLRAAVRDRLAGTPYERALPTLPAARAPQTRFLQPLGDMADLWTRINADAALPDVPRPLVLPGGGTAAQLTGQVDALRAAWAAVAEAEGTLRLMRNRRDALLPGLRARLLEYRRAIAGRLVPADPLAASLPALSARSRRPAPPPTVPAP